MTRTVSRPRKIFRGALLVLLLLSFVFFAAMVTLRMNHSAHWYVVKTYRSEILQADAYKESLKAVFQNQDGQFQTANNLIKLSFFDPSYGTAGLILIKDLADKGYAPSQNEYANIIMRGFRLNNERQIAPVTSEKTRLIQAQYYYRLAAAENYAPARRSLLEMGITAPP